MSGPSPVCPTCGQPATSALGPDEGWECRNEACPEFGQSLRDDDAPAGGAQPGPRLTAPPDGR